MKIRKIEIADDVAEVLRNSRIEGDTLTLPPGQLERGLYTRVDKVLQTLGGKWHRGRQCHVFANNGAGDIAASLAGELNAAIDAGGLVDRKKTLELFETPAVVAESMIGIVARALDAARITRPRVLEPSAGRGRLLAAWRAIFGEDRAEEILAIEVDRANCDVLEAQGIADDVIHHDFLSLGCQVGQQCDVILMNPPFANNADIRHVEHAVYGWLATGGVLVAIMSNHFTFAEDAPSREFRKLIGYEAPGGRQDDRYLCGGDGIVDECVVELLPPGTFKGEGTMVNAVLVTIRKREI